MASFRKALAVFGSMLIALSGQSSAKSLDHSAEQPDLNNDGIVNILDIILLVNYILEN